jgi:hypothetical protein
MQSRRSRQQIEQIDALESWEKYLGIPEHANILYGSRRLGLNWRTYWNYRRGVHRMPSHIYHAMRNIANGEPAWGKE